MAYFLVHSLAVASYRAGSVLYTCAISGTSGSSGFGSVSMEQIERRTDAKKSAHIVFNFRMTQVGQVLRERIPFEIVRAGLHWSLNISRQIEPLLLMFG